MVSLENAVPEVLEELELEEYVDYHIHELVEDKVYHVTFQERANGNNQMVVSVEYSTEIGDLLDDEGWEEEIDVKIIRREGMGPMTAELIFELLAITLDEDYFDSEDEAEEDSDDETLSQPRTPPPRPSQSLVPPPLPRRRR